MAKSKNATPDEKPKTQADEIWEMIRGLPIDLYSLPGQFVEGHVERLDVLPHQVHLKLKSTAVLPAMEDAMKTIKLPEGKAFRVEQQTGYICIELIFAPPVTASLT